MLVLRGLCSETRVSEIPQKIITCRIYDYAEWKYEEEIYTPRWLVHNNPV